MTKDEAHGAAMMLRYSASVLEVFQKRGIEYPQFIASTLRLCLWIIEEEGRGKKLPKKAIMEFITLEFRQHRK